jgi:hypothetical protein
MTNRRFLKILLILNLLLLSYFIFKPYAFYKAITIRFIDDTSLLLKMDTSISNDLLYNTINSLKKIPTTVYATTKQERINKFLNGEGNCSNQAIAMGEILNNHKKKYQIIHLLPLFDFTIGGGHTLLQTNLNDSLALIDITGRAIIRYRNKLIDAKELESIINTKNKSLIRLEILNNLRYETEKYYYNHKQDYVLGIIPDREFLKFYSFISYLPSIKNEDKFTQSIYYGLASLFNKLPNVYINKSNKKKIFRGTFIFDFTFSYGLLISTWVTILYLTFMTVNFLLNTKKII